MFEVFPLCWLLKVQSSPDVVREPDFMPAFHGLQNMPLMPILAIPEVRYTRKSQEVRGRKDVLQKWSHAC